MPDGEQPVIDWADNNSANYEMIIEMPLGSVADSDGIDRIFTLVGLDSFESGMRTVSLLDGKAPSANYGCYPSYDGRRQHAIPRMECWRPAHLCSINGAPHEVEIVGTATAELARTMYFLRGDLSEIIGVNATSMYLELPEGVEVDSALGEVSTGVIQRQTLLDGINSLLDQQTQIFQAMMYLGLMFTVVVMFNTMIMNVAERDFELATLRVLGASTRSLGLMLLFESLLIGIIGGIVGVLFAYGGAVGLAASFSSWQFFVPVTIVPSVAWQLMSGVILIAVAMTPFGVWRLRRMDLVEKIKDLSN